MGYEGELRELAAALAGDKELGPLMGAENLAEGGPVDLELAAYRVETAGENCGSVCGCDADKGVGCEGDHGENDKGGDCPYKVG